MTRTHEEVAAALRQVDLFAELPEPRLGWLAERAEQVCLDDGAELVHEGQTPTHFNVLVAGGIDWVMSVDGRPTVVNHHSPVNYSGTINLLTGEPLAVTGRATGETELLRFGRDTLFGLVRDEPDVLREIVRQVRPNFERAQAIARQREKLASLGSLAAGLAHEINNPAAAARAAVGDLRRIVEGLREGAAGLAGLEPAALEAVVAAVAVGASTAGERDADEDPLAVADREDELGVWLEEREVEGAWELASELAGAGLDTGWAGQIEAAVGRERLGGVLGWATPGVASTGLLDELADALKRVSELVAAIKSYSYMDQAPEQEVDVHEGLESTLTILAHKLKRAEISVQRDYDRSLPRITAAGSELNQVWTNLIDNAIAAAPGGRIRVSTGRRGDRVRVEVADDGAGIPPDVQARLFEPFFTTKAVGEGTGLGLDVAYRVVVQSHGGELNVSSKPGDTRFEVLLPVGEGNGAGG